MSTQAMQVFDEVLLPMIVHASVNDITSRHPQKDRGLECTAVVTCGIVMRRSKIQLE